MTQAPANTSAVRASTYVPVTDAGLAASGAIIRAERATAEKAVFLMFMAFMAGDLRWALQQATVPPLAARVGTDGLAIRAERGLGQDAPVRRRFIGIVQRRFERIHRRLDVHPLGAQLEAMHPNGNLRRGQRFHGRPLTRLATRRRAGWRARRRSWRPESCRRSG